MFLIFLVFHVTFFCSHILSIVAVVSVRCAMRIQWSEQIKWYKRRAVQLECGYHLLAFIYLCITLALKSLFSYCFPPQVKRFVILCTEQKSIVHIKCDKSLLFKSFLIECREYMRRLWVSLFLSLFQLANTTWSRRNICFVSFHVSFNRLMEHF